MVALVFGIGVGGRGAVAEPDATKPADAPGPAAG